MVFIRARLLMPKRVLYDSASGERVVFRDGSRAWRTTNPGNIKFGTFADEHGAIGNDGLNAVFPDRETGSAAITSLLKTPTYRQLSIFKAIARYAPPSENDTAAYQAFVARETGLILDRGMQSLSEQELSSVVKVIEKMEGWTPGAIETLDVATPPVGSGGTGTGIPAANEWATTSAAGDAARWMNVAKAEAALPAVERSQWPDPGENPRILRYFHEGVGSWFTDVDTEGDEIDWCAAFVNWCLVSAGYGGTQHPGARSFSWPNRNFVKLDQPVFGGVVVFRDRPFDDPAWKTGTGHVGFFLGEDADKVRVLGGNQSDTVQEATFRKKTFDSQGNVTRQIVAYVIPARG